MNSILILYSLLNPFFSLLIKRLEFFVLFYGPNEYRTVSNAVFKFSLTYLTMDKAKQYSNLHLLVVISDIFA